MAEFIHENRDDFGVEPVCEIVQVAPLMYYASHAVALVGSHAAGYGDDAAPAGSVLSELHAAWRAQFVEGGTPCRL
jgi:hypothetical protein